MVQGAKNCMSLHVKEAFLYVLPLNTRP